MGSVNMMKGLGKLALREKANKIGVIFLKERGKNNNRLPISGETIIKGYE